MRSKFLGTLIAFIFVSGSLYSASFTSVASGNWDNPATWGVAGFPVAGDDVTIATGTIVSININSACQSLILDGTGRIDFPSNNTLTVSGNVTMNGTSQVTGTSNSQILNIGGNFSVPFGQHATIGSLQLNVTGTTTINGYLLFATSGTGNKTFNNTISVTFGGTWDNQVGENINVNCNIANDGSWLQPISGSGIYQVTINATSYTYSGTKPINMTELRLTNATGTTITNLGTLVLSRNSGGNLLSVGAGRSFINGDGVVAALLQINGGDAINNAGTINFSRANSTVEYMLAGAQNIFTTTYNRLSCSNSGTKTLTANIVVNSEVNISGSVLLDVQTNTLSGAGNLIMTGTSELKLSKVGAFILPQLTGTSNSLAPGTTITFSGAGVQTAKASSATNPSTTNSYPYQNVKISGNSVTSNVNFSNVSLISGNLQFTNLGRINSNPVMTVVGTFNFGPSATTVLANNMSVGNIIFSGGTLDYSNRTITINGNNGTWTNNGGTTFLNTASVVAFTAGTNQQITGTTNTTFTSLTINNINGVTLTGAINQIQATGTLTFTSGNIITGTKSVYVPTGGLVSRTSGHVDGFFQKGISAGSPSVTFEVGTGTTYAPVTVDFTSVTIPGSLTCSANSPDHPDINGSNVEPLRSTNLWWTLMNIGIGFTSYDATFNFNAPDVDVLANPANFRVKRFNGTFWFSTPVGTRTATSTQFAGELSANLPDMLQQEFQCGEIISTTGVVNRVTGFADWSNPATWIQNRSGTLTLTNASSTITGTSTSFIAELAPGDIIMLQTSPDIPYTVTAINSATSIDVAPPPSVSVSGGFGRQYVPNAIIDSVIVGNSNIIPDAATDINFDMPVPTLINSLNINTVSVPRTTPQSVTHSVPNLLTVQTNVTVNQGGGSMTNAWNLNAGNATVNGSVVIGSAIDDNTNISQVNITSGILTTGNLTFNTSFDTGNEVTAVLDMSGGAGTINMLGQLNFINDMGLLVPGTLSTFNYQRSASGQRIAWPTSNQSATKWTYNHLRLNNTHTSGAFVQAGDDITVADDGTINVAGDIRIETGQLITSDNTDITGSGTATFQIDPGAKLIMTGNISTFPTGYGTINPGIAAPFGTVSYEQTNPVTIDAPTLGFGNLQILNPGFTATLPASLTIEGNLTVGNGAQATTLQGNSTSLISITNSVSISTGSTLNANSNGRIASITIGGNWTNNGIFIPSSNVADPGVIFNGTGLVQPQTIGGTSADTFFNLAINTTPITTNRVSLLKAINTSNKLTLTLGELDLNGRVLSITNANTGAIVRTGGYVKSENTSLPYGTVKWTVGNSTGAFVYPFGKSATEYIPFTFNITSAGSPAGTPSISVSTYPTANNNTPLAATVTNLNGTAGGNSVVDRFWIITDNGFTTRPTSTMTFTAVGGNGATPPSERPASIPDLSAPGVKIEAQRWNPTGHWDAALPGQSFINNSPAANFLQVTVPGVSNYSPWALADVVAPLPIQLTEFKAKQNLNVVELNWRTASELNNDYFTIERSATGEKFEELQRIPGAGTRPHETKYITTDDSPLLGRSYYRLKQTDFDGYFSYSKIVSVDFVEVISWSVYPNPSNGNEFNVNFSRNDLGKTAIVKLQDLEGREIFQLSLENLSTTQARIGIQERLSSGIYIVTLAIERQLVRYKLVVR